MIRFMFKKLMMRFLFKKLMMRIIGKEWDECVGFIELCFRKFLNFL